MHTLALHPDVQDELRRELLAAEAHSDGSDADVLDHLPLLDAVIRETLRLYVYL